MKNAWYLVAALSVISIFIQLYKLISLKSNINFIDIILGVIAGLGLLIASYIKIKENKTI